MPEKGVVVHVHLCVKEYELALFVKNEGVDLNQRSVQIYIGFVKG